MSKVTIELINDYFIEVDEMNHTLKQRYTGKDKDGNPKDDCERTIGYYPNVQACVERIVRLICLDDNDSAVISLREYAEARDEALKWNRQNENNSYKDGFTDAMNAIETLIHAPSEAREHLMHILEELGKKNEYDRE